MRTQYCVKQPNQFRQIFCALDRKHLFDILLFFLMNRLYQSLSWKSKNVLSFWLILDKYAAKHAKTMWIAVFSHENDAYHRKTVWNDADWWCFTPVSCISTQNDGIYINLPKTIDILRGGYNKITKSQGGINMRITLDTDKKNITVP